MIEWGAAALAAAALYALPAVVFRLEGGAGWWLALVGILAVLAAYAHWRASPLALLGLAVAIVIAGIPFIGVTAAGRSCGDSSTASMLQGTGTLVILVLLGAIGLHRRGRLVLLVPGALLVAALWVVAVAHLVPGGTGACFN